MRTVEEIESDILGIESIDEFPELLAELYLALKGDMSLDRLREICEAERDGRCVVLPSIPYNKTLYWIWGDEVMPVHYRGILGGTVTKDGVYHVSCNMVTKKSRSFPYVYRGKRCVNTYKAGNRRMFYADDIGKTVFLTRAEAEAALKGGGV